jgi:hypothetical protein
LLSKEIIEKLYKVPPFVDLSKENLMKYGFTEEESNEAMIHINNPYNGNDHAIVLSHKLWRRLEYELAPTEEYMKCENVKKIVDKLNSMRNQLIVLKELDVEITKDNVTNYITDDEAEEYFNYLYWKTFYKPGEIR